MLRRVQKQGTKDLVFAGDTYQGSDMETLQPKKVCGIYCSGDLEIGCNLELRPGKTAGLCAGIYTFGKLTVNTFTSDLKAYGNDTVLSHDTESGQAMTYGIYARTGIETNTLGNITAVGSDIAYAPSFIKGGLVKSYGIYAYGISNIHVGKLIAKGGDINVTYYRNCAYAAESYGICNEQALTLTGDSTSKG